MSWRRKDDLGTSIVAKVHDQLKLSDQWLIDCGRGFTYWPSDHAITVVADLPNFHNAYSIFRLHSEIEVAKADSKSQDVEATLMEAMCRAALSGLTYDSEKKLYKMHCSVYAHVDNEEWLSRIFLAAVGLQIARTESLADLCEKHGLTPAVSGHPTKGRRDQSDPMTHAVEQFFRPYGAMPSRWEGGDEWEEAHENIYRLAQASQTDGRSELRGSFAWLPDQPMQLAISAKEANDDLGNGLALRLTLPWSDNSADRAHTAMLLNELERKEWNWCDDIGSWCVDGTDLAFNCFIPNVAYVRGALPALAHTMALRANWVNEHAAMMAIGVRGAPIA